ncbi:uncharacterized protein B0H18DRAFT_1122831 [Fomitopsis serialis]|uniref:uncharacterized protein n=1 Tax=Fomitopsis serialis TaxID=139415 RepID=UPI002007659F|nr:uncharacterized protein B0H18DRAFT_1122831 [Neoantrodia serialis]KAH9918863.1 hypothetical protein B0H18DRAFT_1122831 [Neoantrodia serialis]
MSVKARNSKQAIDKKEVCHAGNIVPSTDKQAHPGQLLADMSRFQAEHGLESLDPTGIIPGVNDTVGALLAAIKASHSKNTFVSGVIELTERHRMFIGGGDLKAGRQSISPSSPSSSSTRASSRSRLHPTTRPQSRKSKDISKCSVIVDMVDTHHLFRHPEPGAMEYQTDCAFEMSR